MDLEGSILILIVTAILAAIINGALGYGFSSTTVPVALLFYTNRILNPALVLIEVAINIYVTIINLKSVPSIWKKVLPILLGLIPGVLVGSLLLSVVHSGWLKLGTFTVLLPLILIQAAGIRRPIQSAWKFGVPFGTGVGMLYAVTTISGPLLAVNFNNQGYVKQEFRAAIGLIRICLSSLTALSYYSLGLYHAESFHLLQSIWPGVLIGIPLGALLIRKMDPETFRRVCMSVDAWLVGFGLSRVLIELKIWESPIAYSILAIVVMIDAYLLFHYFTRRRLGLIERPTIRAA